MLKKIFATLALVAAAAHGWAAVDVNVATDDALRGIKGIGPAKAKAIIDERSAHGPFKDAADLARRVKGMGGKTLERLAAEGLAIGAAGARPPAAAATAAATAAPQRAGAAKK
ncbi:competence protein ComE [Burkholderia singularis]|uniref:Competence protein ComE n=2 Tax=Burkholderia singularis TaxID=1503053 RepID=A0A103DYX3_9BURK|nr:helix-hairpin-helix domain-containing protein [Burkholderia singularis]KVE25265.1 competence protein ComE [Burkholderia singularis]